MENDKPTRKTISFGCGGPVLTGVIVAARACTSNLPMEEWSVLSWFLMTLPITLIPAVMGLFLLGCSLVYVLIRAYETVASWFRR